MKTTKPNSVVVKGDLRGVEIEPGTFHVHNFSEIAGNLTELPAPTEIVAEDADVMITSVIETDVEF
jgi:hypothetical protein